MPHNQTAEQSILGTIILNNAHFDKVDFLRPEQFYFEEHQKIFEQIKRNLEGDKMVANQITLKQFFESEPSIKAIGGSSYISELLGHASGLVNISDYGKLIVKLWQKRELQNSFNTVDLSLPIEQLKSDLNEKFDALELMTDDEPKLISKISQETVQKYLTGKIDQIKTGFSNIDQKVILEPGVLAVIAGRPSMGKSTLALNIARNISQKEAVVLFSLEMSESQISTKFLAEKASVNPYRLKFNRMNQDEMQSLSKVEISNKLFVVDKAGVTLSYIRSVAKQMKRKHKIRAIVIDHIHIMTSINKKDSRERQIAEITSGLKTIAKDLGIVVIALCQLNRENERREDKRPTLSDLRDSGSIEQDADIIMFVHRDEYYLERIPEQPGSRNFDKWLEALNHWKGKALVSVAKNRDGESCNFTMGFDGEFGRFSEIDQH